MDPPLNVSRHNSTSLQHPAPDLQSLQGAYVSNIERLEESAERLSVSSDIGEELRKMKLEQKRSESRRSSFMNSQPDAMQPSHSMNRQISYGYGSHASSSIVGTNNVARSGGFSPAGYYASPRSSVRSLSRSHHDSLKDRSVSHGQPLTQVISEPQREGKPLDSPLSMRFTSLALSQGSPTQALRATNDRPFSLNDIVIPHSEDPEPEPKESTMDDTDNHRLSSDTYRQTDALFSDFDGVHTAPLLGESLIEQPPMDRPQSSQFLDRPQSYMQPPPGENMVYYPAPVPMMLNLPKRLSRMPAAPQRDKRRSEILGNLPPEARMSATWLPEIPRMSDNERPEEGGQSVRPTNQKRRTVADLPPQLRASMFFDYPAVSHDVEVKGESAVATLDSILDASAFAPVSAFTDHPIAGRVGGEVYGREPLKPKKITPRVEPLQSQKRRSTINLVSKRDSSTNLLDVKKRNSSLLSLGNPFAKRKSSVPQSEDAEGHLREIDAADAHGEGAPLHSHDEADNEEQDEFEDAQEEVEEHAEEQNQLLGFSEKPTTLLAELQLRKQQLKLRNRTAATAFPDGMHSTLLQLDAVAQVQERSRKQKHTVLAWEDPNANHAGPENDDDEDTPLGMLYPGKRMEAHRFDEDRPLGLIAQRAIEDNEPLSHRRARLRGEDAAPRNHSLDQRDSMYMHDFPHLTRSKPEAPIPEEHADGGDDPNETLAQRIKRLKATQVPNNLRPVSTDFTSEIMSQFGGLDSPEQPKPTAATTTGTSAPKEGDDEEEETLGQRRARLQAQAKPHPLNPETQPQPQLQNRPPLATRHSMADILSVHPAAGASAGRTLSHELKFAPAPQKTRNTPWAVQVNRQASMGQVPMAAGMGVGWNGYGNGAGGGGGGGMAPHPIVAQTGQGKVGGGFDTGRRDMIDRWRQSVLY